MNNNTTSNQENTLKPADNMVWEAPVLYKEEWINTLTELPGSPEPEGGDS
jgi:hypothetical protein